MTGRAMAVGCQSEMRSPESLFSGRQALPAGRYEHRSIQLPLIASAVLNLVQHRRHMTARWAMGLNTAIVCFSCSVSQQESIGCQPTRLVPDRFLLDSSSRWSPSTCLHLLFDSLYPEENGSSFSGKPQLILKVYGSLLAVPLTDAQTRLATSGGLCQRTYTRQSLPRNLGVAIQWC